MIWKNPEGIHHFRIIVSNEVVSMAAIISVSLSYGNANPLNLLAKITVTSAGGNLHLPG